MQDYTVTFEGRMPLVVHNIRLSNPLDEYTKAIKAITSKRKKTEDDILGMVQKEWEGGLYWAPELGPYLPVTYPTRCLRDAGAITRDRPTVSRGVTIMAEDGSERIPIEYDGPRDIDGLWADDEYRLIVMVRVNSSRTLRSRPRFPVPWCIRFHASIDTEIIDPRTFEDICHRAGRNIGIGENPYGMRARFDATVVPIADEGTGLRRAA